MRRYFALFAVVVAMTSACARSRYKLHPGDNLAIPAGLDSAALANWVNDRRAECDGTLIQLFDEGGATRQYDRPPVSPRRYSTTLAGVMCQKKGR